MKAKLLFLHALSPLHAGTGQGVGAIDLPIAREKATGIPIVPGSTLKGVLRASCEGDEEVKARVFGPEAANASDYAGSAQFSDLRLLFLPVRSFCGTFAWVTSPLLLNRFRRDCEMAHVAIPATFPGVSDLNTCLVASPKSQLTLTLDKRPGQVVLEDLRLTAQTTDGLDTLLGWLKPLIFERDLTWQGLFAERACVVHDDILGFLLDTATEVTAQIRLDEKKKTVASGALWYEESLPAETILSGLMITQTIKATEEEVLGVVSVAIREPLQVGGSATVGRGLCRIHLVQ